MVKGAKFDVFLSHAFEDKAALAKPLNDALGSRGIKVWYSGDELRVGDFLIDKIREGLSKCDIAIVIVSPRYLSKFWTQAEFNHFFENQIVSKKRILPVLLDITQQELAIRSIVMANIWSLKAEIGVDLLATKLDDRIKELQRTSIRRKYLKRLILTAAFVVAAVSFLTISQFVDFTGTAPEDVVRESVDARIASLATKSEVTLIEWNSANNVTQVPSDKGAAIYRVYDQIDSKYRNEYVLETGLSLVRSKKNVERTLKLDMDVLTPVNAFDLDSCKVFYLNYGDGASKKIEQLLFVNLRPVTYSIRSSISFRGRNEVEIRYVNPLRVIEITMSAPSNSTDTKRYTVEVIALDPDELYTFVIRGDKWILESIQSGN